MSPISHMSTCAAPAPAAPTTMAIAAISGTRRPTSRRRRGRRKPASAGPSDGATGSDARPPSAMSMSPANPARGVLFEEHPGVLAVRHGGLGDLRERAREHAAARGREPREGSEQPLLHGLGGAAQHGPAGGGERQLDAAGIGDGVPPRHEPMLDEPPHDDGYGALVGVRAGGERAEGRSARTRRRSAFITVRTSSACPRRPLRRRRSIGPHTMTAGVAMPNAGEDFCYDRLVPTPVLVRRLAAALDGPDGPGGGAQLLVAVSGGPDSTALLAALAELAPERGLRLAAAHVDHGLRGPESAADRERAARLAHALGVPFCWRQAAVAPGPGVEARARRARYAALEALARETGAARIVTGHTRDDQVETVLLRLLRGAGRSGLAGMRACRGLLWRP